MLRVVAGELRHRRSRALALLLGILVATTGFTVLTGTSESQRLEVRGTVARSYRGDYDVLVRPSGSRTAFERRTSLVQPNFLSGLYGGITMAQWRRIQRLPGVQVAAPIANVGYVLVSVPVPVDLSRYSGSHGRVLLRAKLAWSSDRGLTRLPDSPLYAYVTDHLLRNPGAGHPDLPTYLADAPRERPAPGRRPVPVCTTTFYEEQMAVGGPFSWRNRSQLSCYGRRPPVESSYDYAFHRERPRVELTWTFPMLLSAIDPRAEAQLTGLDHALTGGRYLGEREGNRRSRPFGSAPRYRNTLMPVLVADRPPLDLHAEVTVERLSHAAAQGMLQRHWSERDTLAILRYLKAAAPGKVVARLRQEPQRAYARVVGELHGANNTAFDGRVLRPGPTVYRRRGGALVARPQARPLRGVWGFTYAYIGGPVPPADQDRAFRPLTSVVPSVGASSPTLFYRGMFDPGRLRVPRGPTAPPETVFGTPALTPRDARASRLLGGMALVANGNVAGYLAQPPGLITTLRAARTFTSDVYPQNLGDPPISAIRVRVAGVTGIDALSRERVREAAQRIAAATGLDVDIIAGASGAPTALDLPAGRFGRPRLALNELWIRKGVATHVLQAVDRKSVVLFTLILVVCALFVANATSAAVRARRTELGVLSSLGWSTGRLFAVVLVEVAAIGLAAGLLGGLLALPLAALVGVGASPARAAIAVPAATLLAVLAGLVPALRAARAEPIAAVRPVVLEARRAWRPHTLRALALINLLRTPGRTALGALGLAIGVGALTLLLAATLAFHDTLVGTLLGAAVAVDVRGSDYVAVVATVLLGLAAVTDVLFLNLRERSPELATLAATGWDDTALGRLLALEGMWIGALGALVGAGVGLAAAALFAGVLPLVLVLTALAAAAVGTVLAGVAGLVPAAWLRRSPAIALLANE